MLLVFQSQGFRPLELLVHFIPNHSSINEDKNHSGEKQQLEDFPLLSGANPTAHVLLHAEHTQQLSPKNFPLFMGFTFQEQSFKPGFSRSDGSRSSGVEHPFPGWRKSFPYSSVYFHPEKKKKKEKLQKVNKRRFFPSSKQTEVVLS